MSDSTRSRIRTMTEILVRYSSLAAAAAAEDDARARHFWMELIEDTNERIKTLLEEV